MTGPLAGIRVVDATQMISGPFATMVLGDQGADVIKIEPPGAGDVVRYFGATRGGMSALFATTNRNKRGIAIDLRKKRGVGLLKEIVAGADVFVQNFRPGAADRMGIGEPALRAVAPDLVYVSISGFGERGPYADQRVYDPVIQALSGLAAVQADAETKRPHMAQTLLPDKLTAITAAQAICAALFARERTGQGQHVKLAMLDAMVAWLWPDGMWNHTLMGEGVINELPGGFNLVFETQNGFITAAALQDKEWEGMVRALDRPELASDARFKTVQDRTAHVDAMLTLVGDALRTRTTEAWLERLRQQDVPCAPILDREQVIEHPQIRANKLLQESVHPAAGPMREPRPAADFGETPSEVRLPAPQLGEHTDDVLAGLGHTPREIGSLRDQGVVA